MTTTTTNWSNASIWAKEEDEERVRRGDYRGKKEGGGGGRKKRIRRGGGRGRVDGGMLRDWGREGLWVQGGDEGKRSQW